MKILFLTPWYPEDKNPNHGIFVREQAAALATHHEVVLISAKIRYDKFRLASYQIEESSFGKLKEYRVSIQRSLPIYNQLNFFIISMRVASKIARTFKPDVIHGNIGYPGGFWSYLVSKVVHRPYIITEHTFIYNNFRSWLHKRLTLFSMRRAGAVITVSRKAALEIEGYIKKPVLVVHNIIDTARFSIQPYAQGVIHIGFLGRLSSEQHVKGLDVLLKAISKIRKEFVLDIAGDGHLMAEYQSTAVQLGIAEKCRFHGFIGYDDVPGFMSRLHFFVNTSRFESFGIAIVEAMASGLPVVSFDNGGPADFVNSSNGILVENQNEEKLVQALDAMISNYSSYKRERIREGVMMKFSRDKFTSAMEDIYSSAVKQFLIRQLP